MSVQFVRTTSGARKTGRGGVISNYELICAARKIICQPGGLNLPQRAYERMHRTVAYQWRKHAKCQAPVDKPSSAVTIIPNLQQVGGTQ